VKQHKTPLKKNIRQLQTTKGFNFLNFVDSITLLTTGQFLSSPNYSQKCEIFFSKLQLPGISLKYTSKTISHLTNTQYKHQLTREAIVNAQIQLKYILKL